LDSGKGLIATLITIAIFSVVGEFIRQRFRYTLRQLLIAITVIAVFVGFFSQSLWQARKQQQVVATVIRSGGSVTYESDDSGGGWFQTDSGIVLPSWLQSVLGEDVFKNVALVSLHGSSVRDSDLQPFGDALKELRKLYLSNTQITNAGLVHLKGLTNLDTLILTNTKITDAGLVHLKDLTNLIWLDLSHTQITDAGLEHLKELTNPLYLNLNFTQLTDEGVKKLRQALPNCTIDYLLQ